MFESISALEQSLNAGRVEPRRLVESCILHGKEFRVHPLGFIASTIMVEGGVKARVHVWPVIKLKEQSSDCMVHDHVFEFTSWVLAGAVENIDYPKFKIGSGRSTYAATYSGSKSILTKTEALVDLGEPVKKIITAGGSYKVTAGCLHETRQVGDFGAVTVLITHDADIVSPMVVGLVEGDYSYEFDRCLISGEDLISYLIGVC